MASNLPASWQKLQDSLLSYNHGQIIELTCKTLLYGIYLCLVPVTVQAMITNGVQSRSRKCFLVIIASLFTLMTAYWICSIFFTVQFIDSLGKSVTLCHINNSTGSHCLLHEIEAINTSLSSSALQTMLFDILLINFVIADAVVVWRAWVLCPDQNRVILVIPVVMLVINTLLYLTTVTARAVQIIIYNRTGYIHLHFMLDIAQVVHLALSLIINISATSIIAFKAWKYRKLLMESGISVRTPRGAFGILALLVESGMIYILIGLTTVVSIAISLRFKHTEVSTICTIVGIQLAGIYPIVVVLLVEKKRSLSSTYLSGTLLTSWGQPSSPPVEITVEPMSFAYRPVVASGSSDQIDSATKPSFSVLASYGSTLPWDQETQA